jgi:RNA polymerase sigma-70 factor (ECF subfamily)
MTEPAPLEDFPALYDAYFDRVYGYILCRVRDRAEADDVVSRVFERALRGFGGYRAKRGSLEVWLFAIARNAVRDQYRSWWRRWTRPLEEAEALVSRLPGAHESLENKEERDRLLDAVSGLDAREKDILGLKFQARLTNREISGVLRLKESHVAVLIFRAVRKLKDALGEDVKP